MPTRNDPPLELNSFQGVSPVLLSSSCDVSANNSNAPGLKDLVYPFRKALLIEEIRWVMRMASATAVNLGALVSTKMQIGRNYLMRDQVPVWLLGTRMPSSQEEAIDAALATDTTYSHYRWRLPEPLYVAAGQTLTPTFFRGIDGFGTINVQVSFAGRTVAPNQVVPRIIPVPYAARFLTTIGNTYQQSNENHLINPFEKPMRIQRLTGRMLAFVSGVSAVETEIFTAAIGGVTATTVLMNDSWGGKMINNNTGPSDAFDIQRAAWTVDTDMPAKGIYLARVWNINSAQSLHIGMIGTREEEV